MFIVAPGPVTVDLPLGHSPPVQHVELVVDAEQARLRHAEQPVFPAMSGVQRAVGRDKISGGLAMIVPPVIVEPRSRPVCRWSC